MNLTGNDDFSSSLIGLVGGCGGMGQFFHKLFTEAGYRVLVSDLDTLITNEDIARRCDVVVMCTSERIAVTILKEIGPLMRPEQLLLDVCSHKENMVGVMLSESSAQVLGTHPMFGPFTEGVRGQNVIFCRGRGTIGADWLGKMLEDLGATVTSMEPEDHDRHMALVQGLTHFVTICIGRTLQNMNVNPDDTQKLSTPVFRIKNELVGRLFAQDLDLYASLVGDNKFTGELVGAFQDSMKECSKALLSGDREEGVSFLKDIKEYFGDYCDRSLVTSNKFLSIILNEDS